LTHRYITHAALLATLAWPCCLCRRPFTQVALPGTPLAQCCSYACAEQAEGPHA
jgi:hypothetical protein